MREAPLSTTKTQVRRSAAIMLVSAALAVIVLAGAYLRLVGLDWDENQHLHPDERFLTMVTTSMMPVKSLGEYFDTPTSTLNPNNVGYGFFVYGDFPVIMSKYAGDAVGKSDYFNIYLVGRVLSACADLGVLLLTFFIGLELFDWRIGLLASAIYAAAALPIQQSHYFTVDTFTNLFVAASFWCIARLSKHDRWIDYGLFGITFGLAVASKISVFPLAIILTLVVGLRAWNQARLLQRENNAGEPSQNSAFWSAVIRVAGPRLLLAALVSIAVFRVTQPYAFLPPNSAISIDEDKLGSAMALLSRIANPIGFRPNPAWLSQMNEVRAQISGYSDIPPNHQWGKRAPLLYPWLNMVQEGFGTPLGIFCWLAFAWALWEIVRRHRNSDNLLPVVLWIGIMFFWQGIGWVTTMRYFLPIYAFLVLLAAWAIVTLWDRIARLVQSRGASWSHWSMWISPSVAGLILISSYGWGFAVSRIYTRPVTRVEASRWMLENIPSDVTLVFKTPQGQRVFQLGLPNNYPSAVDNASSEDPTRPVVSHTRISGGATQAFAFAAPFDGTLTEIRMGRVLDASGAGTRTLRVGITTGSNGTDWLTQAQTVDDFTSASAPRGHSADFRVAPLVMASGQLYYFAVQTDPGPPIDIFSATIATEGDWDDPLPLSLPPYNVWGAQFQGYQLQMAWDDIPEKRARMQYVLDDSDYIVISSNRFYGAMPRNPQRFPLTIAYYQALFDGRLGFDLVADFTSRPNLGPIQFFDDNAEEAWTVYDHPRVMIFKKTERYLSSNTAAILGSVDLSKVVKAIAKDAQGDPVVLHPPTLSQAQQQTGPSADKYLLPNPSFEVALGDFYRNAQWVAVIVWWLLIAVIGWIAYPILFTLLPGLPDRAFPLARTFGLILVAWLSWLSASVGLVPWSPWAILIVLGLIAVIAALLMARQRTELIKWMVAEGRHLLFLELLTLLLFLFFLLVRIGNPDLWHPSFGGEKPMDMAYFNAVLKSSSFPPYDPWFGGSTINYYYFGYVIVGVPVKLLGIPTTIAYNLIIPTLFALTGVSAFSVAYNLVRLTYLKNASVVETPSPVTEDQQPHFWQLLKAWPHISVSDLWASLTTRAAGDHRSISWPAYAAGIGSLFMGIILGNLDQIRTLVWGLAELGSGQSEWASTALPAFGDILRGLQLTLSQGQLLPVGLGEWYWNATRLIPVPIVNNVPTEVGPITEFPFFTFLYADLHAHMIAMPITLLVLAWCVAQLASVRTEQTGSRHSTYMPLFLNLALGALMIGVLRPTNTWDWPTYLMIGAGALLLAHLYRRGDTRALPALTAGMLGAILVGCMAYLFVASPNPAQPAPTWLEAIVVLVGAGFGFALGFGTLLALTYSTHEGEPVATQLRPWVTVLGALGQIAVMVGLTFLFFLPYILNYKLAYTSFILWDGSRTPLWAYLDILGLFLFVIISWLTLETVKWVRALRSYGLVSRRHVVPVLLALGGIVGFIVIIVSKHYDVVAVALPSMIWAVVLFVRADQPIEKRATLALVAMAFGLSMIVEVVVLQGDISRMNTVFKFYVQVWLLLAISAGAALGWSVSELRRLSEAPKTLWIGAFSLLVLLAALYPLLATRAKIADRWSTAAPKTLDGMAYMPYVERFENGVAFSLKPDYEALRWMQDNIQGTPIVLEAHTVEYMWGNRVTVYTGLPAVIGWNWHQRQQHSDRSDEVWTRVAAVDEIYSTTQLDRALSLMHQYNVKLIIVGDLERAYYSPVGLGKFRTLADEGTLKVLYNKDDTAIYELIDGQS